MRKFLVFSGLFRLLKYLKKFKYSTVIKIFSGIEFDPIWQHYVYWNSRIRLMGSHRSEDILARLIKRRTLLTENILY